MTSTTANESHKKTIYLIEDDLDIRDSVQALLEFEGYDVKMASNGKEALEALKSSRDYPDLILLDLMMPVMNGWEFLDAIEKELPLVAERTPIIVFSASREFPQSRVRAQLKKPVEADDLIAAVEAHAL